MGRGRPAKRREDVEAGEVQPVAGEDGLHFSPDDSPGLLDAAGQAHGCHIKVRSFAAPLLQDVVYMAHRYTLPAICLEVKIFILTSR